MADIARLARQDVNISDPTDSTKRVSVITDGSTERLAVDGTFSQAETGSPTRVAEPVSKWEGFNTVDAKINFTVPTGKKLFITTLFISEGADGGTLPILWEADNVAFAGQTVSSDGTQFGQITTNPENPIGPFAAGVEIEAERSGGDPAKAWGAGFLGYLEDA